MEKTSKSILLLGCGYVGTAVAQACLEEGWVVSALTRNQGQAEVLRKMKLNKLVVADLDSDVWHDALSGSWDFVLNSVSSAGNGVLGYQKSYVDGTQSILNWASKNKIAKFLYTSSTSVYSQSSDLVTEESLTECLTERSKLLLEAEHLLSSNASLFDDYYIFRLSGIYGPGRHYLLNQLRSGIEEIAGAGNYRLNLIYLEDIVRAILCAFEAPKSLSGIYNISDGKPSLKSDLLEYLAKKLGVSTPLFNPSIKTGRLAGFAGNPPDRTISNKKAQELLGWKPIYSDFYSGYERIFEKEGMDS